MVQKFPFIILVAYLLFVQPAVAQDAFPLRDAIECTPRAGLPNVRAKIEAGKIIRIAYLGGSITAAAGWRIQSREWLEKTYPNAKFEEIHAAIGGTGSDLGVFRLQNDALRHKPDLLFVEFAVNDGGAPPERIHKAMEGIVRQTWNANPETDIFYVYTIHENMLKEMQAGKMPRAASAMELLADYYGIPSIHFGVKVAAMEKAGALIFKGEKPKDAANEKPPVFSTDGVHPLAETGHKIYTETIARNWPSIWNVSGKVTPHELIAPLREDNWEQAKQIPLSEKMLTGEWEKLPADHAIAKRFARNMSQMFKAKSPGAALTFKLNGTMASVFDIVGPDGGQLEITIDGEARKPVKRIDGYCTYHRMSKTQIASSLEAGTHDICITLSPEKLDKREILFERNWESFDKNPDRYTDHVWYASSLLILGDIVE